jgi:hypothetical protein
MMPHRGSDMSNVWQFFEFVQFTAFLILGGKCQCGYFPQRIIDEIGYLPITREQISLNTGCSTIARLLQRGCIRFRSATSRKVCQVSIGIDSSGDLLLAHLHAAG